MQDESGFAPFARQSGINALTGKVRNGTQLSGTLPKNMWFRQGAERLAMLVKSVGCGQDCGHHSGKAFRWPHGPV